MEDYKNMQLFKDRLKWARLRKGGLEGKEISQAELAKRVSRRTKKPFPQSTIGAYESGSRGTKGTPKEIFAIAAELDVSAEWLSKNIGSPFDKNDVESFSQAQFSKQTQINWPFSITYDQYMEIGKDQRDIFDISIKAVYDEHMKKKKKTSERQGKINSG